MENTKPKSRLKKVLIIIGIIIFVIAIGIFILLKLTTYHDSRAMTRSPSPLAWRPDFPGAPREAH